MFLILRAKIENMILPDNILRYIPQASGNFGIFFGKFRIIISKVGGKL